MKRYFLIRQESDPKIIGAKDGITQVEIKKTGFSNPADFDDLITFFHSFTYWNKQNFAPSKEFSIEYVEILAWTKLTDFIGYRPRLTACPFIVSEKVKSIFEEHLIQEHYLFPIKMYKKGELVNASYSLMYCPPLPFEIVDYAQSIFYTGTKGLNKKEVRLNNQQEYMSFLEKDALIEPERIVLSDKFDSEIDFFMPRVGGIYASERLAKRMVEEKLTGIKVITDTQCISSV